VPESSSQALLVASSGRRPAVLGSQRVSDAERGAVADELSRHYTEGRLDQDEFSERMDQAMRAKTYLDLTGLLRDLPHGQDPWRAPAATGPTADGKRRARTSPLLLVILIAVLIITAAHALAWVLAPVLWTAVLAAVILIALRHRGHRR
jgi:Domain of unknown function (DUF1707)